jgi:RimJ/RimL family protein N-acetyltransferase
LYKEEFPKKIGSNGANFVLRLMSSPDRNAILHLAQHLSEVDLSFMRRDITQPAMVDAWVRDIEAGRAITILAEDTDRIAAYATLHCNQFFWSRHLAEIRILVTSPYRNRRLGSLLTAELMNIARELRLEKVMSYMAVEDKSAQRMLEGHGFRAEALLADWVKTRDDRTHDLVIMCASLK